MNGEPVYGLTLAQNVALESLVRQSKRGARSAPYIPPANRSGSSLARLMTIGTEFPVYNPLETREAALFELSRHTQQATVKFIGQNLWGRVLLTVGSISIEIDCRADSTQLRSRLQALSRCRITAFPGLWEFAFDPGTTELPAITCEPVITSNSQRFLGGCVVTREGWRSVTTDNFEPAIVEVIDCIPYIEGEVKLGAMAIGHRYGASLFLAGEWSCPAFTFRSV